MEINRCYQHVKNYRKIYICGVCNTFAYGECFVGEDTQGKAVFVVSEKDWKDIEPKDFMNSI